MAACEWAGLLEDVSSEKAMLYFYWFIDRRLYVQQSHDGNTRNNNEKPSTKKKVNIQSINS